MQHTDQPPSPRARRTAPHAFWLIAQHFLTVLSSLFGEPADLARQHTLTAKAYALTRSWLSVAEALLRRLIAIEAAAYTPTPSRTRAPRQRARKLVEFFPDQPEAWRVSFRCFVDRRRPRRPATARAGETPAVHNNRFHDAWPLALRYEALLRAYDNPEPYARRLAARLRRAPQRIAAILRAPPEAIHRIDDFERIGETAAQPWAPAPDTS